jgi:hypothetical protein
MNSTGQVILVFIIELFCVSVIFVHFSITYRGRQLVLKGNGWGELLILFIAFLMPFSLCVPVQLLLHWNGHTTIENIWSVKTIHSGRWYTQSLIYFKFA